VTFDDFGNGYSGLNCLRNFPVDAPKLDQAFIRPIITPGEDTTLVTAMIDSIHFSC
jgi:EAL domain-containing protein (putative c-di-GMP-specific phosphodiesterase class I)